MEHNKKEKMLNVISSAQQRETQVNFFLKTLISCKKNNKIQINKNIEKVQYKQQINDSKVKF
jgi:hypothetical protein